MERACARIRAAVEAHGGAFADRVDVSLWRVELPGVSEEEARAAVEAFMAAGEVPVARMTKQGMRTFDARAAVVDITVGNSPDPRGSAPSEVTPAGYAIIELVVRLASPTVRPDDVLSGLRVVAALEPKSPARAIRLAQGTLTAAGDFVDPLSADRDAAGPATISGAPPTAVE